MIANRITYNHNKLLYKIKHWLVFCLILILGIKPIASFSLVFVETKLELSENISIDSPEEKENELVNDDDHKKNSNPLAGTIASHPMKSLSYFEIHKSHINFNSDIHLPPPKS